MYVHNTYIKQFSETGLMGGLGFLALIFFIATYSIKYVNIKKYPEAKYVFFGILSMFINVFFDFDFSIRPIFLLTFSLIAFANNKYANEKLLTKYKDSYLKILTFVSIQ